MENMAMGLVHIGKLTANDLLHRNDELHLEDNSTDDSEHQRSR